MGLPGIILYPYSRHAVSLNFPVEQHWIAGKQLWSSMRRHTTLNRRAGHLSESATPTCPAPLPHAAVH